MEVSIIVPVYNTEEQKLRRCLNSIITQDFEDFECIIIDDGSTSAIGGVCDEYAANDSRLKVIHKKNGGVSSARNVGLDAAKGEWIVCIDSDDYVLPCHLSSFLSLADENTDMVLTSFRLLYPDKTTVHHYTDSVYIGKDEVEDFICHTDFLEYQIPWDKMYRRSMIIENNIRFDENLSLSEDRLFCYHALAFISGIATSSSITYIHDGTDLSTLSYRLPDIEMQKHLCKQIGAATNIICDRFGIDGDNALQLWKSYWTIYETLIRSSYSQRAGLLKSASLQRRISQELFNSTLYLQIKHSQNVKRYMQDLTKRLITHNCFILYNAKNQLYYLKSKLFRK